MFGIPDRIKKLNDRYHAEIIDLHHAQYYDIATSGYRDMDPNRETGGLTHAHKDTQDQLLDVPLVTGLVVNNDDIVENSIPITMIYV